MGGVITDSSHSCFEGPEGKSVDGCGFFSSFFMSTPGVFGTLLCFSSGFLPSSPMPPGHLIESTVGGGNCELCIRFGE